ncbi:MAG: hypothetical protein H7268_12725 [Sandarakinorhabdus sp.]|nr:hypothetical protein [Sandarakinorhabdus sp.]
MRSKILKRSDSPHGRPAGRRGLPPPNPSDGVALPRRPYFLPSFLPSLLTSFLPASGGRGQNPGPHSIDFPPTNRQIPPMADTPKTLAEPAREWIAQRVNSGAWPNEQAYLNNLVARDQEQAEKLAALNAAIDAGLASGFVEKSIDEVFAEIRQRHSNAA